MSKENIDILTTDFFHRINTIIHTTPHFVRGDMSVSEIISVCCDQ